MESEEITGVASVPAATMLAYLLRVLQTVMQF
jgi:hypothetical protein